jgi:hypothetical protein
LIEGRNWHRITVDYFGNREWISLIWGEGDGREKKLSLRFLAGSKFGKKKSLICRTDVRRMAITSLSLAKISSTVWFGLDGESTRNDRRSTAFHSTQTETVNKKLI